MRTPPWCGDDATRGGVFALFPVMYVHPPAVKLALVGHPLTLTEVDSFLNSASRKQQKNTPQYKGVFSVF
jgi:hypothetical protein